MFPRCWRIGNSPPPDKPCFYIQVITGLNIKLNIYLTKRWSPSLKQRGRPHSKFIILFKWRWWARELPSTKIRDFGPPPLVVPKEIFALLTCSISLTATPLRHKTSQIVFSFHSKSSQLRCGSDPLKSSRFSGTPFTPCIAHWARSFSLPRSLSANEEVSLRITSVLRKQYNRLCPETVRRTTSLRRNFTTK